MLDRRNQFKKPNHHSHNSLHSKKSPHSKAGSARKISKNSKDDHGLPVNLEPANLALGIPEKKNSSRSRPGSSAGRKSPKSVRVVTPKGEEIVLHELHQSLNDRDHIAAPTLTVNGVSHSSPRHSKTPSGSRIEEPLN
jgi:hypothetical protein